MQIRRLATFSVAALLLQACTPAASTDVEPLSPPAEVEIRHFTGSDGSMRFVSLEPIRVGVKRSIEDERVLLHVGALYGGPVDGATGPHTLALVLRTVSRGDRALLNDGRDLLLEVDGTYVTSNPRPGGKIYTVEGTAKGVQETVMVPLAPRLMEQVARARMVRGRLGEWFTFVLPPRHREALLRILAEIPEDAVFPADTRMRTIVASVSD